MPSFTHHHTSVYYEEFGQGFPLLTFASGGLQSTMAAWPRPAVPVNPTTAFAANCRVMAMDQRNAGGQSHAPLTAQDGWHTYLADHIALLDHLGIEQGHLYGQCIGGSFIMRLLQVQPQRIACAVVAPPLGRVGAMLPGRAATAHFDAWAKTLQDHPEATEQVLDAVYQNLYGPDFVLSGERAFVASCQTPCLVLAGNDAAHPVAIAEELVKLLPQAAFIPEWKDGAVLVAATARMKQFLADHTPVRASPHHPAPVR